MNSHEKNILTILQSSFNKSTVYSSPCYDNKDEFCDILIKYKNNILIFQLKCREGDKYISSASQTQPWKYMQKELLNHAVKQSKKNIKYLYDGGVIYTDKKKISVINEEQCNYFYFIILDGHTQYMDSIQRKKHRIDAKFDGGLSLSLNKTIARIFDNEFLIDIKDLDCGSHIINIMDSESLQYNKGGVINNIFHHFFASDGMGIDMEAKYICYLRLKLNWLRYMLRCNKNLYIADERSLCAMYFCFQNKLPYSYNEIQSRFDKYYNILKPYATQFKTLEICFYRRVLPGELIDYVHVDPVWEDIISILKHMHEQFKRVN